MATKTDIVNVALRRIGADRVANVDNDGSKEGRVARDLYDEARRDLLSQHNWNFAIKRDGLTVSATAPETGWNYAFPLLDDFIRMISVTQSDDDTDVVPYKLEFQAGDDRVVLVNTTACYIQYVFDLDDASVMSPAFRDVLAWRLARDFAGALSKSAAAAELCDRAYSKALSRAKSVDGMEDWPEKMADGDWITSRQGHDQTGRF